MHGEIVIDAMKALAGHQVTDVEELYGLIGNESAADSMPREIWKGLVDLLRTLGYRQRWVRPLDGGRSGYKWVRDPWPIDFDTLNEGEIETYVAFD